MVLLAKPKQEDGEVEISVAFLEQLFSDYPQRDFRVRLWNGTNWGSCHPRFTLVLNHPGALRSIFSSPSNLGLGEAYIFRDFDIEGDIEAVFRVAEWLFEQEHHVLKKLLSRTTLGKFPPGQSLRTVVRYGRLRGPIHSMERDRQAINYHYDLPPDFYRLFLDQQMMYSCAYFASPEDDLDSAQQHKVEYICRKLRLCRGDRLLDIGCGWGALIIHAALEYGANCLGITLSSKQAEYGRERIRHAGLEDCCKINVCDYRNLDSSAQFDKIVSVGMFEHVGKALLPEYFDRVWCLLRPEGTFLNQGIAASATYHQHGPSFIDKYVFPDGELVPISTTLQIAEQSQFEVRDVESLREHYSLTLHHWVHRLEARIDEARRITDDTTFRIWRLYMAGSAHWFRTAKLNLYQSLLAKPVHGCTGLPITRSDWYRK
jgi:cyclopropane-fatty-acyl-phospholipid synthase